MTSQPEKDEKSLRVLESQLRGSFGKVVYSHKTHEKAADIILHRLSIVKVLYIILSALSTGGFVSEFIAPEAIGSLLGAIFSSSLLALNLFTKDRDGAGLAQEHRQAASEIWLIREEYESLIADLTGGLRTPDTVRDMRNELMADLHAVYKKSPKTNSNAYNKARKALKYNEELTFSDAEIDKFLPEDLRREQA